MSWNEAPVRGVPPPDPFGTRRPGKAAQIGVVFDPVRVATFSGSASTGIIQTPDLGTFTPADGATMLYVVGGITASGGAIVALYLYASPLVGADPLDVAVTYAAGVQNTASAWVPQTGQITYGVQLATAPTYSGYLAVAGWIRNP